jgi:hypothetical protein
LLAPFESVQELIPGPLAPSEQEKLVGADWPSAYVARDTAEKIDADGAPATVYEIELLAVWPSLEVAVTV